MTIPPHPGEGSVEEQLRHSLKELADIRFALDASAILAITDSRGLITHANDNFCRISEYARVELIGQNHRIINSGYHPREFFRTLWKTISSGQIWRGEIKNRAKSGTFYWVDTTIVPLLGTDGRPEQYISIRYDITERKRLETELVRAAQLSLVGEMAAGLAHEIKNPLAGIQGAVDILIRRREPSDPEREALENVRHEVNRIDATVRSILDHARPRSIRRAPASLVETVRRAVLLADDQSEGSRLPIELTLDVGCHDRQLCIDADQFEDAVLNLVLNAIEAIDGEGVVRVRVSIEDETAIVQVEDNGRGIAETDLPRIFNPFFTTRSKGTGLGLPAVRRIARAHGGRVDVRSVPGEGTVFTIRIPVEA